MNERDCFLQDSCFTLESEINPSKSIQMDEENIELLLDSSRNYYNQELVWLVAEYVDWYDLDVAVPPRCVSLDVWLVSHAADYRDSPADWMKDVNGDHVGSLNDP